MSAAYQFGISEFTTWPWTFEQDVENYAALGVDCIEVCEFKLDPSRAEEQLALVKAKGLTITSVQPRLHSLFPDQPRPEPKQPSERMARYRTTIDLFGKAAPGTTLVTIPGAAPDYDFREAYAVAAREYRALADYAADHGLRIALEPLNPILMNADTFICTLPDAMRVVEAVNRPNFGVWVDVWHIWEDAAATEHIRKCGDRIFGVHVNDWHMPRCFGDRVTIGRGEIDLPPLLRAIHDTGYRGAYTTEIFSDEKLPDSLWLADLSQVIRDNQSGFAIAWEQAGCS